MTSGDAAPILLGRGGAVAEWSKALAWKVSIRQNRIEGSNPSRSASFTLKMAQNSANLRPETVRTEIRGEKHA